MSSAQFKIHLLLLPRLFHQLLPKSYNRRRHHLHRNAMLCHFPRQLGNHRSTNMIHNLRFIIRHDTLHTLPAIRQNHVQHTRQIRGPPPSLSPSTPTHHLRQTPMPPKILHPHLPVIRPKQHIVLPHPIMRQFVNQRPDQLLIRAKSPQILRPQLDIDPQTAIGIISQQTLPPPVLRLQHDTIVDRIHFAQRVHEQLPRSQNGHDAGIEDHPF
mmetsp:Transcript_20344/g.41089  ORF Transcript_20344/g.41089 Transcript_20344/m.41089 type:complete len:213 (+) Transcript_20344:319-957(+)